MGKPSTVKTGRTQAERREEAERRLLNAAIKLIVDKGYDRFSLAEVGDLAGYSRGLPAHYFGKKEDLLSEVARYLVLNYRDSATGTDGIEPGLPRLTARMRHYASQMGTRGSRALGVLIADARYHPTLRRTITELNQRARARWEAELRRGAEAGNIRPDIDLAASASIVHAFLRGLFTFVDLDPSFNAAKATEVFIGFLEQQIGLKTESARARPQALALSKNRAQRA